MRSTKWARWATCAIAISICVPAVADRAKRSLSECTAFDQADKGDDAVKFSIHNGCSVAVDCSISWKVVCAPDAKHPQIHSESSKLAIVDNTTLSTDASAAVCGDKAWAIQSIEWSCLPSKE